MLSLHKIVYSYDKKLLNAGRDHGDASLIMWYLVILYESILQNQMNRIKISYKSNCQMFKWTTDFWVTIIESQRLPNCFRNHNTKFEVERTIITCFN